MATRAPLTLTEKERLYAEKIRGRSLGPIAAELGRSPETARKWCIWPTITGAPPSTKRGVDGPLRACSPVSRQPSLSEPWP